MRVGVVIPTRNNRPKLLERCLFYVKRQTANIERIEIVNYPQKRHPIDLTERYEFGIKKIASETDVIFLMEDDDWYSPIYIQYMLEEWQKNKNPDIFGIGETYFYHPTAGYYWHKLHAERASAFSTMLKSNIINKINWRKMDELYTDIHLWKQLHGTTFIPSQPISIGIKHGRGPCGAAGHNAWFYERGIDSGRAKKDNNLNWLESKIGKEDADFYRDFAKEKWV